jgi:hypothetical protein
MEDSKKEKAKPQFTIWMNQETLEMFSEIYLIRIKKGDKVTKRKIIEDAINILHQIEIDDKVLIPTKTIYLRDEEHNQTKGF